MSSANSWGCAGEGFRGGYRVCVPVLLPPAPPSSTPAQHHARNCHVWGCATGVLCNTGAAACSTAAGSTFGGRLGVFRACLFGDLWLCAAPSPHRGCVCGEKTGQGLPWAGFNGWFWGFPASPQQLEAGKRLLLLGMWFWSHPSSLLVPAGTTSSFFQQPPALQGHRLALRFASKSPPGPCCWLQNLQPPWHGSHHDIHVPAGRSALQPKNWLGGGSGGRG